ncbi:MAG TPA: hypothetical protein VK484_13970 [Ferruginibacter sp.]|nr:hypothetical protein [Ferruginibacter sp.]
MNTKKCIGSAVLIMALQSCVFGWLGKVRAKANECCNFETKFNKVNFRCGDEKIIFLRISVASNTPNVAGRTFYEAEYIPPVNELIIPELPDSIKQTREIIIDVWKANQTIQDYRMEVTSGDWQSGNTVYSRYSYR